MIASICVLIININSIVNADSLSAQRNRYAKIKQAWDHHHMNIVYTLMPTLTKYPLYPYLEYRRIINNLMNKSAITINKFIHANPTLPYIQQLKSKFINELARREDWYGLLTFSPNKPVTTEAQCNFYYAKCMIGHKKEAWSGAKTLWLSGKNQPNACNILFSVWHASNTQDPLFWFNRICLAMKNGNTHLVTTLAAQIPYISQDLSNAIIKLAHNPNTIANFLHVTGINNFSRQMSIIAFSNIAQNNAENARIMIPFLARNQKLNRQQTQELSDIVAWHLMNNHVTHEQAIWRDNVIMHSNSISLVEQRVRMALRSGNHRSLHAWISRLPQKVKKKDVWDYWQAILLLEHGRKNKAKIILHSLMQQQGFYSMVAAQKLGEKYQFKIHKTLSNVNHTIMHRPEIARIHELIYWNLHDVAHNEWLNLITNCTVQERMQLAHYAFNHGWWDLSVQATVIGKLWNYLEERFPLAYKDIFARYTNNKDISQSYAMAIARQESAWNPRIRSSVGASGLMQIMPDTAKHTAKMFGISEYDSPSQLMEPEININIGTSYLQYVYQQFNKNRIFASAAYNAGPERVRTWLSNSSGHIDAIAFVESIPFSETRSYVKNVLVYDVYYRYLMGHKDKLLSNDEWHRYY